MKEYMPDSTGPVFVDRGPKRATTFDRVKMATPWRENLVPQCGEVTYRHPDGYGERNGPYLEADVKAIVRNGRERPRDLGSLADLALANDVESREDLRAIEDWARAEATLAGEGQRERHDGDEYRDDPRAYEYTSHDPHATSSRS